MPVGDLSPLSKARPVEDAGSTGDALCYDAHNSRMEKDFNRWNEQKKALHASAAPRVYVHERELWFAHLGTNIGFEQDGRG